MKPAVIVTTPEELREIIREELRAMAPKKDEPEVLTRAQCAELLGVHERTVPALVETRGLPCAGRIGKLWRFRRSEVLAWLDSRRKAMKKAGPDSA